MVEDTAAVVVAATAVLVVVEEATATAMDTATDIPMGMMTIVVGMMAIALSIKDTPPGMI